MKLYQLFRRSLKAAVLAAAAMSLAGQAARAADPGITDTEIKIGMFGPLSGPMVAYGIDPVNAAKLVYDDVNARGGIHGRKVKLVIEDDKCLPNELVSVVKKLVTVDNVFMLNGGSCTAAIAGATEFLMREKVPLVSLNAAGDSYVFPPQRYIFGAMAAQRTYASASVQFADKVLHAKRIAIIVHDDDYGKANLATARAAAAQLGLQVVAAERIPPNINDVTAPMINIRGAKPDVIISGAYPAPAVLIAQKYGEFGMASIPLVQAPQGIPTASAFAKNVGNDAALKNFYYPWPFNDGTDPALRARLVAAYMKAYPGREPGPFMSSGIQSPQMVVAALEKAGRNLTREGFVGAMESLDMKLEITPGNIKYAPDRRDPLRSTGILKFDGKTNTTMPGIYTWDGKQGM